MDLTVLLDSIGEGPTAALGGVIIGGLFGAFGQRSRFCLRSAVIEFTRGSVGMKVAVWVLAFSAAVFGVQMAIGSGLMDVSEARQLAGAGSLSGAVIGGAMFGTGMILARGCASRLLILSANGNLRALLSGLIFAVTAQASLRGALSPLRDSLAGLWVVTEAQTLHLLNFLGLGGDTGMALGLVFVLCAVVIALRCRLPFWSWIGAIGVGLMVVMGWLFTSSLSTQAFTPVGVESMSFTGPSADTLMLALSHRESWDFDVGLVPGVFLGSFLAALLARELKLEGFQGGAHMRRYIIGAVLMGFGGMLAGGCAVGAGVSGGSVFATVSWLALASIWAAAGITDYLIDRRPALTAAPLPQGARSAASS